MDVPPAKQVAILSDGTVYFALIKFEFCQVIARSYFTVEGILLLIQRTDCYDVRSVVSAVINPGTKSCI